MSIPFLPGNTITHPRALQQRKTQSLSFKNGLVTVKSTVPPVPAADRGSAALMAQQRTGTYDPSLTFARRSTGAALGASNSKFVPSFAALADLVMHFDAYFREAVHESRDERQRVRRVKLHYYIEDDTLSITERKDNNSGMPQGVLLKRHLVPRANGTGNVALEDLVVGSDIMIYGRVYRIVDASPETRDYLTSVGLDAGEAESVPGDEYQTRREMFFGAPQRSSTRTGEEAKLRRFLDKDGQVLRFYALWDDRASMFGEPRPLVVHFYLADGTLELLESSKPNSGRDPFPVFLRRQRVPLRLQASSVATVGTSETGTEYLTEAHLQIGKPINVLGRVILLHDWDDFTRQYYAEHFGVTEAPVVRREARPAPLPKMQYPPHTGIGSDDDSLGSCIAIVPKPPKKDFKKYLVNDRKILRFGARLETTKLDDIDRQFIVSYFLADDTILVFERPIRNSGIVGGKFLERCKVKKPASQAYYSERDLFVGARVEFFRHKFILTDADDFAYDFMEANPSDYPQSNIDLIVNKLRRLAAAKNVSVREVFDAIDTDGSGFISLDEFSAAVTQLGFNLSDQEMITLMRHFDPNRDGRVTYKEFCSAIGVSAGELEVGDVTALLDRTRDILRRRGAESIAGLGRSFRIMDDNNSRTLEPAEFTKAMTSYGISLDASEIEALFRYFDTDGNGSINYDEFLIALRGELNDRRRALVHRAFKMLDRNASGTIEIDDICATYNARFHPEVQAGRMTERDALRQFLANFDTKVADGRVTLDEWEKYYANISCSIDNDDHFELLMNNAWNFARLPPKPKGDALNL